MAWKNQGGGPWGPGPKGPWGGGPQSSGPNPPDLEDIIRRSQDKIRSIVPGGRFGGIGVVLIAAGAIMLWFLSGSLMAQPLQSSTYHLSSGDVIRISVFGEPDLSFEQVRLNDAGMFSYPFIGEVRAKGKTALEIEQVLLGHPEILECAVVGVADEEWGERVCAAIRWRGSFQLSMDELRSWAREQLAIYKVPSRVLAVDSLPRNAMGKVIKKEVALLFTPREAPAS